MKILQINAVYGMMSTGRIVAQIDEVLKKEGIQSIIATTRTTVKRDNIYIVGTNIERKMHALFSRLTGKQGYFSLFATKRLLKWIKKESPDLIHLHNLHANYIHLPTLLTYLAQNDIPTVVTLHDCWFFTGKCTHYTVEKCYKWQTGCYNCSKLKDDHSSWFFDKTTKMWQDKKHNFCAIPRLGVIGVSNWITCEAKKSPFFERAQCFERIYNWVDLNIFKPLDVDIITKYSLPKNKFLILCVGAMWSEKSRKTKDLISLAKTIDEDTHIVLVGNVSSGLKLPDNVTVLGYITSLCDLAELYANVNVYVHLSYEDTFGKVIAEALACGTPAIVYNTTACPELVDKKCGAIVEPGDMVSLKKELRYVFNGDRQATQQYCRVRTEEFFDMRKNCEKLLAFYKEMM